MPCGVVNTVPQALGQEHTRLAPVVQLSERLQKLQSELAQAREMADEADPELAALARADLSRADLSRADLRGTNLRAANLSRADLSGADLSRAKGILCLPVGDPRGYRPVAVRHTDGWMVASGCRWFPIAEAREHWGAPDYHTPTLAAQYLAALDWLEQQSTGEA